MDIKNWLICRKYQILFTLLIIGLFFIIGCTASGGGGSPPPSGPIGGGCG